jgi:hypothetical protein
METEQHLKALTNVVAVKVSHPEHDKMILENMDGHTFTSNSEEMIDFFSVKENDIWEKIRWYVSENNLTKEDVLDWLEKNFYVNEKF